VVKPFSKHGNILWFVDVGGVLIGKAGDSWSVGKVGPGLLRESEKGSEKRK
jgi:hypothetical protein